MTLVSSVKHRRYPSHMTIVAGFLCPDGFVISADTEITYPPVRYQLTKLSETHRKGSNPPYWMVIGGAGNGDYLDHLTQDIERRVERLSDPSVGAVDQEIKSAVSELHDQTLMPFWATCPDERDNYRVGLLIGLRDSTHQIALWRTLDKAVSVTKHNGSLFLGTGDQVAHYVGETLFQPGMPVAVTHHIATQIVKEARAKGENVGGNIDTCSVRTTMAGYRDYFDTPDPNEYLWGLEDTLNSAVRCSLVGRRDAMRQRLAQITVGLEHLCDCAMSPPGSQDTEWHTMHVFLKHTHPFRDF